MCVVSGSGNVAQHCAAKLIECGAKLVAMSDSRGTIHDPDGIDAEKLNWIMDLKHVNRQCIGEYAEHFKGAEYRPDARPWAIPCDAAFPCATQNELAVDDAETLVRHGCRLVAEGANMPTTPDAVQLFQQRGVMYAPGKAANAGGVAVSGLEMTQNIQFVRWTRQQVDSMLRKIMQDIHHNVRQIAERFDEPNNYVLGANIAGFITVAEAILDQGVV